MKNREIYKRALKLAVPIMIQNGITNMVGLVDNVMVGNIGTEAVTSVAIVCQLIFVFNLAVFGGLSGPGIYGAQFYGQGNTEGVRNTFRIKHIIGLFCLIVGFAVFIIAGDALIRNYMRGESQNVDAALTLKYAHEYLNIMLWSLIPFAITQVYSTTLRETGDSIKPMVAGIVSVFVDVILNYILIYGKLGAPRLGVEGAAIATLTARIIEMLTVLMWAWARKSKHEFLVGAYKTMKIPVELFKTVIKKGLPIFVNEFLWAGAIAIMTQTYSIRGLEIVSGLNISNAICNLLNVVFVALGSAVGILIGQTLGAGQFEKAKKEAFSLMWFSGFVCIGLAVILIAVSGVFPLLYDTTADVRNYAKYFIVITALFFPVQGFLNALYFTLRSGGKTVITFLFDSVYSWVVTLPVACILCYTTNLHIFAVYAIVQAADIIKVIIGYIMIKRGIWISNIVDNM